jgi:ribosome-associated protein
MYQFFDFFDLSKYKYSRFYDLTYIFFPITYRSIVMTNLRKRDFKKEWQISAQKSSGAGGQNVNKVNTKIELRFSIPDSSLLSQQEKEQLLKSLSGKLSKNQELIITSENERSQKMNKEDAVEKFYKILEKNLVKRRKRIPTKPTRASRKRRIDEKKKRSEKKDRRRADKW